MPNVEKIAKLAASVTVCHYFCNVEDFEIPADEVFKDFMGQIDKALEDRGLADQPAYMAFKSESAPSVWEPFEDESLESLYGLLVVMHNSIIRDAVTYGLITEKEAGTITFIF